MAAIILPHRWTRQPPGPVQINDRLPYPPALAWHGAEPLMVHGFAADAPLRRIGNVTISPYGQGGIGVYSDSRSGHGLYWPAPQNANDPPKNFPELQQVTLLCVALGTGGNWQSGFERGRRIYGIGPYSGSQNGWWVGINQTSNAPEDVFGAGNNFTSTGILQTAVCAIDGSAGTVDIWVGGANGLFHGTSLTFTGPLSYDYNIFNEEDKTLTINAASSFSANGAWVYGVAWWPRTLPSLYMRDLVQAPWQVFRPRRRRVYIPSAAVGQTVTVNQALETDTAQAITRLKAKSLGQATETDTAQAITRRKTLAIGQALETDLAQAITHAKAKLLGQVTETDTAQAIAHAKTKALGQATETDLAQAIAVSGNKIIAVGQVTETDTAQPLTARKAKQVDQTTETDAAQAVAHAKTKALGQATETDLAQAITPEIPNQVGQALETDLAQPLSVRKAKALGQTTETDLAQAIAHAKTKGLGLALEIDVGQPIALAPKRRLVAQAIENDLAQTITPILSSAQLPQGKLYTVGQRVGYRVGPRNNFRVDQ